MTSTVIAFPTFLEREDREFRRAGTSSYIRAIDDAETLWSDLIDKGRPADFVGRLNRLARQIAQIAAHRPDVAGDLITLGDVRVELRLVPGLLAAMLRDRAN